MYLLWIPVFLIILASASIWLALTQIADTATMLKYIIIIGNALMAGILSISTLVYIRHFRQVYSNTDAIIKDIPAFKKKLEAGDRYFITFFNWSITNQWLLVTIMLFEIAYIAINFRHLDGHFALLAVDFVIILTEIYYISRFRKRMMDLEMDFNVIVQGKIFFVNQSGILSDTQTIESDKIKTIKSVFPSKLAGFFNYGNIDILTEGDTANIGSMKMFFVTSPVKVVNSIQQLLGEIRSIPPKLRDEIASNNVVQIEQLNSLDSTEQEKNIQQEEDQNKDKEQGMTKLHTMDTRGKVRDILR